MLVDQPSKGEPFAPEYDITTPPFAASPGYRSRIYRVPGFHDLAPNGRGIASEMVTYVVSRQEGRYGGALALTISTGVFPPTVTHRAVNYYPSASNLGYHTTFARGTDIEGYRTEAEYEPCQYLDGPCYYEATGIGADDLWKGLGAGPGNKYPADTAIFAVLRDAFDEWYPKAEAARVDIKYRRCPCCLGTGLEER